MTLLRRLLARLTRRRREDTDPLGQVFVVLDDDDTPGRSTRVWRQPRR